MSSLQCEPHGPRAWPGERISFAQPVALGVPGNSQAGLFEALQGRRGSAGRASLLGLTAEDSAWVSCAGCVDKENISNGSMRTLTREALA